jgi:hypothetical protein
LAIYQRTNPPSEYSAEWWAGELERLEKALALFDLIQLKELHVEPVRPRAGMTVLADGTDWNPGSGQGVYTYYAGAWHKLG